MDYKSAGVLIYKITNNKIFFLLGKENLILSKKNVIKEKNFQILEGKKIIMIIII